MITKDRLKIEIPTFTGPFQDFLYETESLSLWHSFLKGYAFVTDFKAPKRQRNATYEAARYLQRESGYDFVPSKRASEIFGYNVHCRRQCQVSCSNTTRKAA